MNASLRHIVWVLFGLLLYSPQESHAHFLWLLTTPAGEPTGVQVFFGESAEPDDPALLARVTKAQVWLVGERGKATPLELQHADDSLSAKLPAAGTVILNHTYGVSKKGGAPFLLKYYAKTYPTTLPGSWQAVRDVERLPLEIVPALTPAGTRLRILWQGKPLGGAMVTVVGPGIENKLEGNSDEAGVLVCKLPQAGVYSIRARHTEATPGTHGEESYDSIRHYSTLTLHYAPLQVIPVAHQLPDLPKGTTSFGGAVIDDTLFVYGGNYGSAHSYINEEQSGDLWKLDLQKPGTWEVVSTGPRLQGLAMVEHGGWLYRIGGFTATNKQGEKENLVSQADFARFQPATGTWESLPSLPAPRSSHDAARLGDILYVAGGWNMQGGSQNALWHDTALKLDLSRQPLVWEPIAPPPFRRRALSLATWSGKLYCVGGMEQSGTPTRAVSVYDPATNAWSTGPNLLGTVMDGFGNSTFASQGRLYATTFSGAIQRLNNEGTAWEFVGQLDHARFFHRLLPWHQDRLLAVGGASMETGKTESVEWLTTSPSR